MFSCEICESFKNTYFEEHLRTTASKVVEFRALNFMMSSNVYTLNKKHLIIWKVNKGWQWDLTSLRKIAKTVIVILHKLAKFYCQTELTFQIMVVKKW